MSGDEKKVIRVVCYIRVSSQEQKLHGISLDAQRDKLKEYAEKHNLKIVGWYEDEGVSGRKLIKNRPALQRMLKDAQAGKFDRIIFIKLDRFFRSVAEYHECMKIINPVVWTATEEKYDLTTANGRAFVNMKLTIAELEADQTGERINLVNDYKVKTGQALTGSQRQGFGLCVQKIDGVKRVVKDPETSHILDDLINHFLTYQNKRQTYLYIMEKYNIDITYIMVSRILSNPKIYGHHRGNDNYCEPYIDKATFDKMQSIIQNNIKTSPNRRVYLFTGLINCPCCGKTLKSKFSINRLGKEYFHYRCHSHSVLKTCDFSKLASEKKIEKDLLDNLDQYINVHLTDIKISDNKADVDNEEITKQIKAIKLEMKNTTTAFRKDRMTEAEYDKEYEELETRLKALESRLEPVNERDLTIYQELLKSDWKGLYGALNKENKRAFWRKYIKEIQVNDDGTFNRVIFF